jgi:hypothetical protein
MFSELYGFRLSFHSVRCPHLAALETQEMDFCEKCESKDECGGHGGSEFTVNFPIAETSAHENMLLEYEKSAALN